IDILQLLNPGKNLFIDLAEKISQQLNVSDCWVCGGTLRSETWPWRGSSLGPVQLLKWSYQSLGERVKTGEWMLSHSVIEECIWIPGEEFTAEVGETSCKRYIVTNGTSTWWVPKEPKMYWAKRRPRGKRC
ncbi:ENR1 protein, partial [Pachycephala philippinensis]|nr:ENR1 protein [Pachycephala philippinensis]